jgi:hypothetical protein
VPDNPTVTSLTVSDPSTTGAIDLTGKTSGNTVTITADDATVTGNLKAPGKTGTLSYVAAAGTPGNCTQLAADGVGITDAGAPCGTGTPGVVQLAQTVTSGSASSVDFTSITGSYTNLIVAFTTRCNVVGSTADLRMKVNNDGTSGDYTSTEYNISDTTSTSSSTVGSSSLGHWVDNCPGTTAPANYPATGVIRINSYAGTTFYKKFTMNGNYAQATTDGNVLISTTGTWLSTAAITRLTFSPSSSTFTDGTTITLYGER